MAQYLVVRDRLNEWVQGDATNHLVFVTDPKKGALREIANAEGIAAVDIPANVGGRFSVLTPVGILPAALVGIDTAQLLAGAGDIAARCQQRRARTEHRGRLRVAPVSRRHEARAPHPGADAVLRSAARHGRLVRAALGGEPRQASASLATPASARRRSARSARRISTARCSCSWKGPGDKTVTFIAVDEGGTDVAIPKLHSDVKELGYLGGHQLGELLSIEQRATAGALARRGRPNMTIHATACGRLACRRALHAARDRDDLRGRAVRRESARPAGRGAWKAVHVRDARPPRRRAGTTGVESATEAGSRSVFGVSRRRL